MGASYLSGLQPSIHFMAVILGRCPRLVFFAPLVRGLASRFWLVLVRNGYFLKEARQVGKSLIK